MPNLYICKCFIDNDLTAKFKEFYGSENYSEKLSEFSLSLLVAQGIKCAQFNDGKRMLVRFNSVNPYLEVLVEGQLTGNNSHLYAFIDLKYEEISPEQIANL